MTTEAIKSLQKELGSDEALLVASIPNRFYLTGFETSDGFVFVTHDTSISAMWKKQSKSLTVARFIYPLRQLTR